MTQIDEWRTAISKVEPGRIELRGVDLVRLIGSASFAETVYLLFVGKRATPSHARMVDAILVALSDHGVHAPSTLASRIAASSGTPLQASVAAGIAAIGDHHGGALSKAMEILELGLSRTDDPADAARGILARAEERSERLPGFGHPYHRPDQRGVALRELSDSLGVSGRACLVLDALALAVKQEHQDLLPNVDGVAAAILLDIGLSPIFGRGFFIVARAAGLVAHAIEEQVRERPVRMVDPATVAYDGPTSLNSL